MNESPDARRVLKISGSDRIRFLQDLVTNDVKEGDQGLTYAALLSPQGKYLADFFLFQDGDAVYLDADAAQSDGLLARLTMYRLRADVSLEATDIRVELGLGEPPEGAYPDPRVAGFGWRRYGEVAEVAEGYDAALVAQMIPSANADLVPNESYILEMGFERLNGVDFRKGCYVGQEVTARMKHKTELRKGLARLAADGPVRTDEAILCNGKTIGRIGTVADGMALAHLRFDQVGEDMQAGGTRLRVID